MKGPRHHSKTFMFCACFSAFHLFNRKLSCIWKFLIESNGVRIEFEIEKCSELAASLDLYKPGTNRIIQQLIDMLQINFHKETAPVIAGLKRSEKSKLGLNSIQIKEEIEKAVYSLETNPLDEAKRMLFGEAHLLRLNETLGISIEKLLAIVPCKEDRTDQTESSTST